MDPEAYYRLLVMARSLAVARPNNLVKFADRDTTLVGESGNMVKPSAMLPDQQNFPDFTNCAFKIAEILDGIPVLFYLNTCDLGCISVLLLFSVIKIYRGVF